MSKPHLLAVSAHEYTHAWMAENVKPNRVAGMDRDTLEAFCELVAYKYMASRNENGRDGSHQAEHLYERARLPSCSPPTANTGSMM